MIKKKKEREELNTADPFWISLMLGVTDSLSDWKGDRNAFL